MIWMRVLPTGAAVLRRSEENYRARGKKKDSTETEAVAGMIWLRVLPVGARSAQPCFRDLKKTEVPGG